MAQHHIVRSIHESVSADADASFADDERVAPDRHAARFRGARLETNGEGVASGPAIGADDGRVGLRIAAGAHHGAGGAGYPGCAADRGSVARRSVTHGRCGRRCCYGAAADSRRPISVGHRIVADGDCRGAAAEFKLPYFAAGIRRRKIANRHVSCGQSSGKATTGKAGVVVLGICPGIVVRSSIDDTVIVPVEKAVVGQSRSGSDHGNRGDGNGSAARRVLQAGGSHRSKSFVRRVWKACGNALENKRRRHGNA